MSREILFIYAGSGMLGGVETLISRMSNWLINREVNVTLLTGALGAGRVVMPPGLRVVEIGGGIENACDYIRLPSLWASLGISTPTLIKCFDLRGAWIGSILSNFLRPQPKVMIGNYGPGYLPRRGAVWRYLEHRIFFRNVLRNVPPEARLFMSREQIALLKQRYGKTQDAVFAPLPVDGERFRDIVRSPKLGRIVSVGRLDPMKEYNLEMINVISRLRAKGYDVEWTVYGDGQLRGRMECEIENLGLREVVTLKGTVPYEAFGKAMEDAYAFVGMGTSVIEAGFCNVPTVVATAHDPTGVTGGPLYNYPFGNCGEPIEGRAPSNLQVELERLLQLSQSEYNREAEMNYKAASRYGMNDSMEFLIRSADAAPAPRKDLWLWNIYRVHRTLRASFKRARCI